jgi:hypothetical protein
MSKQLLARQSGSVERDRVPAQVGAEAHLRRQADRQDKPKFIVWVTDTVPVITYMGNYTLKLNDATIKVPKVAFNTPNGAKRALWPKHDAKLTRAQENAPDRPPAATFDRGRSLDIANCWAASISACLAAGAPPMW